MTDTYYIHQVSHLQRSLRNAIIVTALADCPVRCRSFRANSSNLRFSYKKKVKSALRWILTFSCYLKLIQPLFYLSLIPRHLSLNQNQKFFPFNIIITLISECKGMKFFHIVQVFLFHKLCDLYHAILFTFAQQCNVVLLNGAKYVAYLQMCSYTII